MSDAKHLIPHQFKQDGRGAPGKPKGAISFVTKVRQTCERLGFDPVEEAIKQFRDLTLKPGTRALYLQMVLDRYAPKLKAVEHTGQNKDIHQVLINIVAQSLDTETRTITNAEPVERIETNVTMSNTDDNIEQYQEVSIDENDA